MDRIEEIRINSVLAAFGNDRKMLINLWYKSMKIITDQTRRVFTHTDPQCILKSFMLLIGVSALIYMDKNT